MSKDGGKSKEQIDLADSQDEAAGRNTGKIKRFYTHPDHDPEHPESQKKKDERFRTELQLRLINDRAYAKLYHQAEFLLDDAQTALRKAFKGLYKIGTLAPEDRKNGVRSLSSS